MRRPLFAPAGRGQLRRVMQATVLVLFAACEESTPAQRIVDDGAPSARLVLSTDRATTGERVVLVIRVTPGAGARPVASFTARITYDPQQLRIAGERATSDGATVVLNANEPGVLRLAGFHADGFGGADLAGVEFVALADHAIGTLDLAFDELHAVGGADLASIARAGRLLEPTLGR